MMIHAHFDLPMVKNILFVLKFWMTFQMIQIITYIRFAVIQCDNRSNLLIFYRLVIRKGTILWQTYELYRYLITFFKIYILCIYGRHQRISSTQIDTNRNWAINRYIFVIVWKYFYQCHN